MFSASVYICCCVGVCMCGSVHSVCVHLYVCVCVCVVRFFSIFSLLHLILKGGLVGCCNQGSWIGSDQSQDIYCSRQEISLSTFSESKYSKYSKWNRALRVAACRGLQEMVVLALCELV